MAYFKLTLTLTQNRYKKESLRLRQQNQSVVREGQVQGEASDHPQELGGPRPFEIHRQAAGEGAPQPENLELTHKTHPRQPRPRLGEERNEEVHDYDPQRFWDSNSFLDPHRRREVAFDQQ